MMPRNTALFIFIFLLLVFSCKQNDRRISDEDYEKTKDALIGANKILVKKDSEKIAGYIKRRSWDMKETKTGLWYMIISPGEGKKAQNGTYITLDYTLTLLDGTLCYSSDIDGPKQFEIGRGGVEAGLEEGVLMLHEGDSARFILPPHLAHGLIGDGEKIPKRAIIVYEVYVRMLEDR
ncbi:MAG: FKBP-type peptidyl-prolyl cis-trans isomerase [Bacteroidales bacterium]|nr:FKBP-type peptidyl-prolyl cis-trans isomerase [Bacteroidales bacterium]